MLQIAGNDDLGTGLDRSVQPQFLTQLSKFIRSLAVLQVIPPPVLTKVLKPDSAMSANHAVRNLTRLQQPDQVRPGHIQEVGRLLRGQLSGVRDDRMPCPLASKARI